MKQSRFLFLVAMAVTVGLGILMLSMKATRTADVSGEMVLAGLDDAVNQVDRIQVTTGTGPAVELIRGEDVWQIQQMEGYPADWPAVRSLLGVLARARVQEYKTENPEFYERLGVQDIEAGNATGKRLDLYAGDQVWSLLIGNDASRQDGQFVRRVGEARTLLTDLSLEMPASPVEWAQREILDIGSAQIAEVEIRNPQGERIRVSRVSADDPNFNLRTLPEGRNAAPYWKLNSMATVFGNLRLEDARLMPETGLAETATLRVILFSGERIVIRLFDRDGQPWVTVAEESAINENKEPTELMMQIGQHKNWIYRISGSKLESFTPSLESMLEPLADNAGTGG